MKLAARAFFAAFLLPAAVLASPADDCDRLAAHPYDFNNPPSIEGVRFERLDADKAVPACRAAHEAAPSNPRYAYKLARATFKAGYPGAAIDLFQEAAAANYPLALVTVGGMYHDGTLLPTDASKAFASFQKAAELGDPRGISMLAYAYEVGIGVVPDAAKTEAVYRQAAATGTQLGIGALQAWQAKQELVRGQSCATRYIGDSLFFGLAEQDTGIFVHGALPDLDPKIALQDAQVTVKCLRSHECLTVVKKGIRELAPSRSFRVCNAGSARFLSDKLSSLIAGRQRGLKGENLPPGP